MKIIIDMPVGWTFDYLTNSRALGREPIYRLCCLSNKTGCPAIGEGESIPEAVQETRREMDRIRKHEEKSDGRSSD